MVLPLLAVFHLTLRSSFGRLDDARRHLERHGSAVSVDRRDAGDGDRRQGRRDAQPRAARAGLRGRPGAGARTSTDEPTLKAIEAAALLHDTGKLAVPEHILNKPGKLTEAEFEQMKQHVDIGADILSLVEFPYPGRADRARPSRELGRQRLSARPAAGDGDSDRRADSVGRRLLRRADLGSARTARRMTDEEAIAILRERQRHDVRPARRRHLHAGLPRHRGRRRGRARAARGDAARDAVAARRCARRRELAPEVSANAPSSLLAFVSLSRVASGDASVADVLALGSRLLADVVPGATGAWYRARRRDAIAWSSRTPSVPRRRRCAG